MSPKAINPPKTYAEWVNILNELKLKTDDQAVLEAMRKGTLQWQSGIAERFTKKLMETLSYRFNNATDKFQKELNYANGRESVIVQALLSLRKEICFLAEATKLPTIPQEFRDLYYNKIVENAVDIQNSLENSAKNDRSGKLYSIVKNNRVNVL